ncbi:unnamed protein product [Linum tenue]|uniref:DRBM domain-containing protein n=1 Tax=Linum tenue TaxID=586396 RepID=A0AAV0INB3_9ROSI|nr:unnamed protein product [Linum tenue]
MNNTEVELPQRLLLPPTAAMAAAFFGGEVGSLFFFLLRRRQLLPRRSVQRQRRRRREIQQAVADLAAVVAVAFLVAVASLVAVLRFSGEEEGEGKEEEMYKNQLQELAQRSCFNLPSYTCIREGPDHAPRFKATVNFNGREEEEDCRRQCGRSEESRTGQSLGWTEESEYLNGKQDDQKETQTRPFSSFAMVDTS